MLITGTETQVQTQLFDPQHPAEVAHDAVTEYVFTLAFSLTGNLPSICDMHVFGL